MAGACRHLPLLIMTEGAATVSVAMTTYNGRLFLAEQLRSLLCQTRRPDEVVICDDGSQDGTAELARQFIRTHGLSGWRVEENPENLGYIRNFRRAMRLTTGSIIFLCDQDDIWAPDKIEAMTAVMAENPEISALASGYRLIDASGAPLPPGKKLYTPRRCAEDKNGLSRVAMGRVFYENMAQGCACAYRRSLADSYCAAPGGEGLPHDWALNLLAYQKDGLYYLRRELISYRIHGGNTTGLSDPQKAVRQRIPRLEAYMAAVRDAARLPLAPQVQRELTRIADFTGARIRFLREKTPCAWLSGAVRHACVWLRYFFRQYLKDLVLAVSGKLPD